jgi:hypothetical protein
MRPVRPIWHHEAMDHHRHPQARHQPGPSMLEPSTATETQTSLCRKRKAGYGHRSQKQLPPPLVRIVIHSDEKGGKCADEKAYPPTGQAEKVTQIRAAPQPLIAGPACGWPQLS